MFKRSCYAAASFSQKKIKWSPNLLDAHLMDDDERYGDVEDDIFGGKFAELYIEKKPKKQILYEKELNLYKKDKDTTENLFVNMISVIPAECVKNIKEFSDTTKVYKHDYMTRCQESFLKFADCKCYYCEKERQEAIDFEIMIEEERVDHMADQYYDW